jgi:hypothetical protein
MVNSFRGDAKRPSGTRWAVRTSFARLAGGKPQTTMERPMNINRNILFLLIGALLVGVGVLSYALYEEKKQPSGVQINLGPGGLKVEKE